MFTKYTNPNNNICYVHVVLLTRSINFNLEHPRMYRVVSLLFLWENHYKLKLM